MLSNLIDEVRSRRVLAIAALALLVALALPLLFLKSAPEGAPAADAAAPAAAEEAKLPDRAARLLATSDADAAAGKAKGSAQDPFRPPPAYRAAAGKGKAAAAPAAARAGSAPKRAGGSGSATRPIPVVIQNADGSRPKPGGSSSGGSTTVTPPVTTSTTGEVAVDIRYAALQNSRIRRAIPRMKPFYIHGKLVAVFVKYSPSRKKATFAVAPGVHVSGPVNCRQREGACRYVDIAAGSHVRLTMLSSTRTLVSRRLDVVHTKWRASRSTRAAAGDGDNACLLRKLLAQRAGDVPLERDACER